MQVEQFANILEGKKSLYGYSDQSTIDSLILDSLPVKATRYYQMKREDIQNYREGEIWVMTLKVVVHGLQKMCGFNIMQVPVT